MLCAEEQAGRWWRYVWLAPQENGVWKFAYALWVSNQSSLRQTFEKRCAGTQRMIVCGCTTTVIAVSVQRQVHRRRFSYAAVLLSFAKTSAFGHLVCNLCSEAPAQGRAHCLAKSICADDSVAFKASSAGMCLVGFILRLRIFVELATLE